MNHAIHSCWHLVAGNLLLRRGSANLSWPPLLQRMIFDHRLRDIIYEQGVANRVFNTATIARNTQRVR